MKKLLGIALTALLATSAVHAKPAKELTKAQKDTIAQQRFIQFAVQHVDKERFYEACFVPLVELKVLNKKNAKKYCNCQTSVYENNLSLKEFWQINNYVLAGKKDIMNLKQLKKITPKLKKCAKDFKFKKPTQPK